MLIRMRPFLLLLALPWCLIGAATAQEQPPPEVGVFSTPAEVSKWETFGSADDEFHARLPSHPSVSDIVRSVKGVRGTEKARLYGVYDGGVAYLVVVYDKPRAGETYDYFFDDLKGRFLKGWGVSFEHEVVMDATAGRHYSLAKGEARGAARFFLKRRHAYMIAAVGGPEDGREVSRFLDSFTMWDYPYEQMRGDDSPGQGDDFLQAPSPPPAAGGDHPPDYSDRSKYLLPGVRVINPSGEGGPPAAGREESQDQPGGDGGRADSLSAKVTYRLLPDGEDGPAREALVLVIPEPAYGVETLQTHPPGKRKLKALLSPSGKVEGVSLVEGAADGLSRRAADALRRTLFIPAVRGGRNVPQWIEAEFEFGPE